MMTNAEAIETLKANYPDACFEQLREAVDAAIEALKAQAALLIPQPEPLTNADRIRAMTDEELAELLEGEYGNMMPNTALSWLKKEVDDATD